MILAIPALYRYIGFALIIALVLGGLYLKGRSDGKAVVQAVLDKQRAVWQAEHDAQVTETKRIEASLASKHEAIVHDLQNQIRAGESSVVGLSRRLRLATSSRVCPLSSDPAVASGDQEGRLADSLAELERRTDAAWAAAAAEYARKRACIAAYDAAVEATQ